MEMKYIFAFSIIWISTLYNSLLYVLGQTNPKCALIVENKEEFMENLNKFYEENSEIQILEYEIDYSRLKPDIDWSNRTDSNAFQPRRWFRTKETNTPQLHLHSQVYLFDVFSFLDILTSKFKKTKVVLSGNLAKCLDGIVGNDMTLFLRDSLLQDFNITSRTRSLTDTEICNTLTERPDPDSFDFTYWCWKYDQGREPISRIVSAGSHLAKSASFFSTAVIILFYMYIPWLIFLFPRKKHRIKKTSITIVYGDYPTIQFLPTETDNGNQKNKIIISKEEMENKFDLTDEIFTTEFNQIHKYQFSDIQIETDLDLFYREGERILYNPRSFVNYVFSTQQESLKYTDRPKSCVAENHPAAIKKALHNATVFKNKLYNNIIFTSFKKVFGFLVFFTLPVVLSCWIKFKPLSIDGPNNITLNCYLIMVILSGVIQIILIVLIFVNECKKRNDHDTSFDFRVAYHAGWNEAFDWFSKVKHFSNCVINKLFVYLVLFPLIILFNLVINCPLTLVTGKNLYKFRPIFKFKMILAFSLCVTLYSSVPIVQFIFITVLFIIYQTTFIYSLFSAMILLLLYARKLLKKIRSKHDRCLNFIVNEVKSKATSTFLGRQNNGTFHILESADSNDNSAKIIQKNGKLHLFIKNGCFYLKEGNTIYVSKDIISHLLRAAYIKTFNKLVFIMIFLTSILLVIGVLGQFDFFTATQQVFITFGTGVLPFMFNILFSNKIYKRAPDIQSQHQFSDNIQSYAESCEIHGIILHDLTESNVDADIVIQREETDIFRHSDDEVNIQLHV